MEGVITMDKGLTWHIQEAAGSPPDDALADSRRRIKAWFTETAPTIYWDAVEAPLGPIYVALSEKGVRNLVFGVAEEEFLNELDPLAHIERNPQALAPVAGQLHTYFTSAFSYFDLPVDLSEATPFQRKALQIARQIPAGSVWTYKQIAEAIGRPSASRAVGQAMARNPVPIIIPCHRVVGSDGSLTGYGGGGGIPTKRWLLQFEGAL